MFFGSPLWKRGSNSYLSVKIWMEVESPVLKEGRSGDAAGIGPRKGRPPIGVRPEMHHELRGREGPNGWCSAANP